MKKYPSKTSNEYGEIIAGPSKEPSKKVSFEAAAGNIDLHYDPQGSGEQHDPYFAEVAPGVADSGNMKFKWGEPNCHWTVEAPASDLAGD